MANITKINGKDVKDSTAVHMASLATIEANTTATTAHEIGSYFWLNEILYETTTAIAVGDTIIVGTNCKEAILGDDVADLKSQLDEVSEVYSSTTSINLFNPAWLTNAGWTYNPETGEFVGTPKQLTDYYGSNGLPIEFIEHTKYCIYFDAYTEGNASTDATNGLIVAVKMTDNQGNTVKLKSNQTTPTTVKCSTYSNMDSRSCAKISFWYEASGSNIWHITNLMLVTGYTQSASDLPAYVPYGTTVTYTAQDLIARNSIRSIYPSWLLRQKYWHHIGVSQYTNIVVPSQSLFDVERAHRLGYGIMELNTQQTSDGVFITIHGDNGTFGQTVKLTDESTSIQSVAINSVTYDYVKTNVRYISLYEKYQTTIPTLEEMLYECRRQNIIPFLKYKSGVIEIADAICGRGNYILGIDQGDRPTGYDGICWAWLAIANVDDLLTKADSIGAPFVCGINATNSAFSGYTLADWRAMAAALHSHGYLAGFVAGYTSEPLTQQLESAGFDCGPSIWPVNDIATPNICDLHGNVDFTDFKVAASATVSGGALTLLENTNISMPDNVPLSTVFLGGAVLRIRFVGSLTIGLGRYIDTTFTSDGLSEMVISTFYENRTPNFYAKAVNGNTTIYDISLKMSKM